MTARAVSLRSLVAIEKPCIQPRSAPRWGIAVPWSSGSRRDDIKAERLMRLRRASSHKPSMDLRAAQVPMFDYFEAELFVPTQASTMSRFTVGGSAVAIAYMQL